MSIGVLVITSPVAATTEAIDDGVTGLVAAVDATDNWVTALERVQRDDVLAEKLRLNARHWVEGNFDAHRNAAKLHERFKEAMAG
jgi:colanic acid/amylovoran biosynthesis glycosyltransferase